MRELSFSFRSLKQNPGLRHVEGRHFELHAAADAQGAELLPVAPRRVTQHAVAVGQLHLEQAVGQHLNYCAVEADGIGARHVRISGSPSVTRTVCSKWADSEPSLETTVQRSFKILTSGRPALTIGSMASVMPGARVGERLPSS